MCVCYCVVTQVLVIEWCRGIPVVSVFLPNDHKPIPVSKVSEFISFICSRFTKNAPMGQKLSYCAFGQLYELARLIMRFLTGA